MDSKSLTNYNGFLSKGLFIILLLLWLIISSFQLPLAANSLDVVINEVAWMGTQASTNDEWIELYNTTDRDIDLAGWTLESADGTPSITLSGIILAKGFFLLERTDDNTVSDIAADQIYTGVLLNTGEALYLKDSAGNVIDTANGDGGGWPAGTAAGGNPPYATMERIDPLTPDTDANWATNNGVHRNGLDVNGDPINGTPKARNSVTNLPPTADAGADQTVNVGDVVQLDGSSSSDPDGDPLSYSWSFISRPTGSAAVLSDPDIVNPTFVADVAGDYVLELTVEDGRGGTDSDQVTITAVRDGDVNGDGKIDLQDAILAAKFALGLLASSEYQRRAADVVAPCDTIDVRDVVRIAEVALGIKDESAFTCSGGSGQSMGVVTPSSTKGSTIIKLHMAYEEILPGGRVTIDISSSAVVEGIQVGPAGSLSFDPQVIQIKEIRGIPPFQLLAHEIDNEAGRAKFMAIAMGEPRDGEIIELEVEAVGQEGESTVVELASDMILDAEGNELEVETAEGWLTIGKAMPLQVDRVLSIPNPVRSGEVRFTVEGRGIKDIQVQIYDLSGREVFSSGWVAGETFEWSLMSSHGQLVANGVYLYIVTVRGFDEGELVKSGVKKLVVLR
jgi:hypothetical protein